jgi:hypothetical protein
MKRAIIIAMLMAVSLTAIAADSGSGKPPARGPVDPALEAQHAKEDIRRQRVMAAAHETAAKCQESGKDEDVCNAELAKSCQGIAYGKYCGMKHPD